MPRATATRLRRPVSTTFEDLLRRAKWGDERAVTALFRDVQPDLLRYLRARANGDAEDIAGQAWLEVARRLRSFEGDHGAFRAWVFTIASRRLANHRRAFARRPASTVAAEVLEGVRDPRDTERIVLEDLTGEEAAELVAHVLPPKQAEIVLLRVVGGLSADEVATITGRTTGAIRVIQHRALQRLATVLGGWL